MSQRTKDENARAETDERTIIVDALRGGLGKTESLGVLRAMLIDTACRLNDPAHIGNQVAWPEHSRMFLHLADLISGEDVNAYPSLWEETRLWRVVDPEGCVWMESSDRQECFSNAREGDTIYRLWRSESFEWREVK